VWGERLDQGFVGKGEGRYERQLKEATADTSTCQVIVCGFSTDLAPGVLVIFGRSLQFKFPFCYSS